MDELQQADLILRRKLEDMKAEERHTQIIGTISMMGEHLTEQIREAIASITFSAPIVNVTIPELPVDILNGIGEKVISQIKDSIAAITITAPEVNVTVPEIKIPDIKVEVPEVKIPTITVPKPEVTVHVPETKFPDIQDPNALPAYDSATRTFSLEPIGETWTMFKEGSAVAIVSMEYYDEDRNELKSFTIERL